MPRFTIRRFRTRRIFETTSYELDASSEEEATETAIRDEDEEWIVDDTETISVNTVVTELAETSDDS